MKAITIGIILSLAGIGLIATTVEASHAEGGVHACDRDFPQFLEDSKQFAGEFYDLTEELPGNNLVESGETRWGTGIEFEAGNDWVSTGDQSAVDFGAFSTVYVGAWNLSGNFETPSDTSFQIRDNQGHNALSIGFKNDLGIRIERTGLTFDSAAGAFDANQVQPVMVWLSEWQGNGQTLIVDVNGTEVINQTVDNRDEQLGATTFDILIGQQGSNINYESRIWARTGTNGTTPILDIETAREIASDTGGWEDTCEGSEVSTWFFKDSPFVPEGSDETAQNFEGIQELRVTWEYNSPEVWVRTHDDITQGEPINRITRLTESLATTTVDRLAYCVGDGLRGTDPGTAWGLTVSTDGLPIAPCRSTSNTGQLVLLNKDASINEFMSNPCTKDNGNAETPWIIESRTGNKVLNIGGDFDCVGQADLQRLLGVTLPFVVSDLSVSHGNESWIGWTGPQGTQIQTDFFGVKLIPNENGIQGDSIQIHDSEVYIAWQANDTVNKYEANPGVGLNLTATATIDTDDIHSLRLSKDGRYLISRSSTKVELWNTTNLQNLESFNIESAKSMDMDGLNNWIFAATDEAVVRFPVFNNTTSDPALGGGGGTPGSPNPDVTTEPHEDETTVPDTREFESDPSTFTPGQTVPEGGFLDTTITFIADGWGFTEASVSLLVSLMIIGIILFKFSKISNSPVVLGGGLLLGMGITMVMGLLPVWILILTAMLIVALVSKVFFGGGGEE